MEDTGCNMNLNDHVYKTNIIPKKLCDELVNELNNIEFKRHDWRTRDNKLDKEGEDSELYMHPASIEQRDSLLPYITKALKQYLDIYNYPGMIKMVTAIRFNKYVEGTEMKQHIDTIPISPNGEYSGIPIISLVGNLNDNYEGASFVINDEEITLTKGDILLFPSTFLYPHKVTKATKGTRYSFAAWAY